MTSNHVLIERIPYYMEIRKLDNVSWDLNHSFQAESFSIFFSIWKMKKKLNRAEISSIQQLAVSFFLNIYCSVKTIEI